MTNVYVGVNDVASELGISPSTVKKYYLAIEEQGYRFRRNQQGNIMFGEHDINMFKGIIILKNQPGMSVKSAIEKVTADITDITPYNPPDDKPNVDMTVMSEQFAELKEMFLTIQADLASIKQEQASQKKLIESAEKPKPEYLAAMEKTTEMFKEVMDQLATSQEKKSFWSRLFK
jgi:hypothetical protein